LFTAVGWKLLLRHTARRNAVRLGRYFLEQICPNKPRCFLLQRPFLSPLIDASTLSRLPKSAWQSSCVIAKQVSCPITIRRCFASTRNSGKLAQKFVRSGVTRRSNIQNEPFRVARIFAYALLRMSCYIPLSSSSSFYSSLDCVCA